MFGLLLFGIPLPATAQSRDDGSLYSRFGLGELRTFTSSQAQAMGGGGLALWSYNYTNAGNPATWGRQLLVRASAGLRFEGLRVTDAGANTKNLTSGSLNAIQFGLPLYTNRLGMGITFEPYSRVNYRVQTLGELITDPTRQDSTLYQITYTGSGGLQQVRAGVGYHVSEALNVGASVDLVFGIIEESRRTIFASTEFSETNVATSTRLFGATGTVGALFSTRGLFGQEDDLSIAGTLTLPLSLSGDRALTLGESLNRDTLGVQVKGTLDVPMSMRFGVAYQTQNRWTLLADVRYEPWSQFDSELSFPGYSTGGTSLFRDRLRVSGGLEVLPGGESLSASYFGRVAYRLGFYYDQAYVAPVSGIDLNTLALTGGFSLPTLLSGTRLDVNVEVGTRGTTDRNLVRDRFFGISATLNIGERWFLKRKLG